MVICVIALAVFGILGIFSARYRALAAEAFDCVFRKVTLRPCATNLNQRIRAKIVAKIFTRSPKVAGLVRRHFEALSWIFVVLTIGSAALVAQAGYNIYKYGTCTPSNPEQCVFVPTGGANIATTTTGGGGANPAASCGSPDCEAGCLLPDKTTCAENCTCTAGTCG